MQLGLKRELTTMELEKRRGENDWHPWGIKMGTPPENRKDNRPILLYKGLPEVKPYFLQMILLDNGHLLVWLTACFLSYTYILIVNFYDKKCLLG